MTWFPSTSSRFQLDLDPCGDDNQMGGMHHIATIRKELTFDFSAVDDDPAWHAWAHTFLDTIAIEVVLAAGDDPAFEADMSLLSSVELEDRPAVVYAQLARLLPDQHALCLMFCANG